MAEISYFILFASGLIMMVKGSDWFVGSAVWAAEVFRIPSIIIGATIVSICTTLPETFVSAAASIKGETAMAAGNALGSIGVNTGLILAILLLTAQPLIESRKEFLKNSFFLVFLLLLLWTLGFLFGEINRPMAFGLLLLFLLFLMNNVISAARLMDLDIQYDIVDESDVVGHLDPYSVMPEGISYDESANDIDVSFQVMTRKVFFFCLGVFFVVFGSNLLVDNGIRIAGLLGVPNFLIAVIFTSVGTSLPELTTVITSVRKGASNLGIGNIIGANILNIVQVVGISALLHPLSLSNEKSILLFQLPSLLLMVLWVVGCGLFSKGKISRWSGILLLLFYMIFLFVNLFREAAPILGPILFS